MPQNLLIPYGRKSSKEDPTVSRARQERATTEWAARKGERLAPMVYEPGVKGSKRWQERGLGEVIQRCIDGEADGIVVEEQSRLSRENGLATAEVWDTLQRHGIRLVCTAEGLDTAERDCELDFAIKAALAREQWKQYARRMDHSKRHTVEERGIHIGQAPTGYVREQGEDGPLRLDKAKWRAIRDAFALRASGASYGEVARFLDHKVPGGARGKGAWTREGVTRILGNRVYLGEARGGKYVKAGAHPAITDEATFATVQALDHKPERTAKPTSKSLLAGKAMCGSCGYALQRQKIGGKWIVYQCRGKSTTGRCPAPVAVMLDKADALVLGAAMDRLEGQEVEAAEVDTSEVRARLAAEEAKAEPFKDPEYVALIGREAAKAALREVAAKVAEVQAELAELVAAAGGKSLPPIDAADVLRTGDVADQREVLGRMLDAVVVYRAAARGRAADIADRILPVWRGQALPIARPTRGRPKVTTGVASA